MLDSKAIVAIIFAILFSFILSIAVWIMAVIKSLGSGKSHNVDSATHTQAEATIEGTLNKGSTTKSATFSFLLFSIVRVVDCILLVIADATETTDESLLIAAAILETLGGTFLLKVFVGFALFNETEQALQTRDGSFRQGRKQVGINFVILGCIIMFIVGASSYPASWSQIVLDISSVVLLATTTACCAACIYMITQCKADVRYLLAIFFLLYRVAYNTASIFDHRISVLFGNAGWPWLAFAVFMPEWVFCTIIGYIQITIIKRERVSPEIHSQNGDLECTLEPVDGQAKTLQ